jgi:2-polyprenyl-3-methyl-5-hydroxy-6-metoxy-1,4-benzoquinol methylase
VATLLAAVCLCAAGQTAKPSTPLSPEAAEFLEWYQGYQGSFYPQDVLKAYRAGLADRGVAAADADRRVGAVMTAMRAMPVEFTTLHFNKIYTSPNPPFRQEASRFLVRIADTLKSGAALDVAMGQGRNALYLASKGWKVTGYDLADQGMAIAQANARKAGLTLETVKSTHDDFDYGKERWDLIVETFAFTNLSDPAYRKRVTESLKTGGVLLIEGFAGPKNELIELFKDLRVVYFEDGEDIADWSMQKMRLARIAARKE